MHKRQFSSHLRSGRARWSFSLFLLALISFLALSANALLAQTSISSVSPASGPTGGGIHVRIFGKNFKPGLTASFSTKQAAVVSLVSSTEVDVRIPYIPIAGRVDVAVISGGSTGRLAGGFTYLAGTPPPPPPPPGTGRGSPLSSCADITKSGAYYLTQNVSSSGTCFFIDADNVSLNLTGHTVTYATSGGSRPAPGVVLADPWYSGYGIARPGSTYNHAGFEIYGGSIVESTNGPARSAAIWVGQSNDITPLPRIHDLTLKTYTTDSSPIFGTVTGGGWQIYNNNIYYSSPSTSSRYSFYGDAIWIGDNEQDPTSTQDLIYGNHIYVAPQGGIRDTHQHAKIYNNDITFNSTYANDFCIDAPADYQEVSGNNCHPASGRGIHTNANYVYIHDNNIAVKELRQNAEYGGCELGGTYGVQVEFDNGFLPNPPVGVRVANNHITAIAGDCDAVGLRLTQMSGRGTVTYTTNTVTTTNQGGSGVDYGISFSGVIESGSNFQYSGNTFSSRYAFVTVDWDGASTVIPAGQHWIGAPQYSIDNQNGYNDPSHTGPTFSQSLTVDDSLSGAIHCGGNAKGYNREGSQSTSCNNVNGIAH